MLDSGSRTKNGAYLFVSGLLLFGGIFGGWHAYSVSRAQFVYHTCKYGLFTGTNFEKKPAVGGSRLFDTCYRASKLYRWNYYFPGYVASRALESALYSSDLETFDENIRRAKAFARRALIINPYDEGARDVYARVLVEMGSVDEAITYWNEKVMPIEPWSSVNRNMLAGLYLRSSADGALSRALEQLPFINDPAIREKLLSARKQLNALKRNEGSKCME